MIQNLHHVQITTPHGTESAAREFYCSFLGLREIPKPASLQGRGGFWLELGLVQVHVSSEDGVDRKKTRAHLAYQVTNLNHWKGRLAERGIETTVGIDVPGMTRFEFRDPFGNRVEFLEITS